MTANDIRKYLDKMSSHMPGETQAWLRDAADTIEQLDSKLITIYHLTYKCDHYYSSAPNTTEVIDRIREITKS